MATLGAMFANTGVKKAETPPQRVTKWIHYTKLKDNAAQYCNERDKDEIIALAGLIDADNGVLQQILVRKIKNDQYEIIAGHKRRRACKYLVEEEGKKQYAFVPCFVENISDVKAEFQLYSSNSHHVKTDYEKMHELERMKYLIETYPEEFPQIQTGRMVEKLAAQMKMNKTTVGEYLTISKNLGENARTAFEDGTIKKSAAVEMAALPEKEQDGVELDSITGRIARLLYPKADIQIKGFEKTDYPNDFFDIAIGNVPFGQYKVLDHAYEKNNFLIHDYFFAKTLDKVRPGGVVAFITSKGTMDKASPEVRRYLAQRANLLGAVRLPNTAFKANAGTEVTSDILFFQKRDRMVVREPDWVYLEENDAGIKMNSYFVNHPEQIVGKMELVSGPYGMESTCRLDESRPFEEQLKEAGGRITGTIDTLELETELDNELSKQSIPADPNVKNFSYALVGNEVYYRENSVMKPVEVSDTAKGRIRGGLHLLAKHKLQ